MVEYLPRMCEALSQSLTPKGVGIGERKKNLAVVVKSWKQTFSLQAGLLSLLGKPG